MIRRLINTLQGKRWAAHCDCGWTTGRADLLEQQARNRLELHSTIRHHSEIIIDSFRSMAGDDALISIDSDRLRGQIRLAKH